MNMKTTISLDGKLAKDIGKVAAERGTTISGLIQDYLTTLASSEKTPRPSSANSMRWSAASNSSISSWTLATEPGSATTYTNGADCLCVLCALCGKSSYLAGATNSAFKTAGISSPRKYNPRAAFISGIATYGLL